MFRVIAIIVLAAFFPMQLYAADLSEFNYDTNTQTESFVPRGRDIQQEQLDQKLTGNILAESPKNVDATGSGTNWWIWGGVAAVVIGAIAIGAGGGGGSGSPGTASGGTVVAGGGTTSVTGSW